MPLNTLAFDDITDPQTLANVPEDYLIFFSSIVDGQLWCPDCRAVDPLIRETFNSPDGPKGLIVYVGTKPQWRTPSNIFRSEPWSISNVPTIIKKEDKKEVKRLGDDIAIKEQLVDFVK